MNPILIAWHSPGRSPVHRRRLPACGPGLGLDRWLRAVACAGGHHPERTATCAAKTYLMCSRSAPRHRPQPQSRRRRMDRQDHLTDDGDFWSAWLAGSDLVGRARTPALLLQVVQPGLRAADCRNAVHAAHGACRRAADGSKEPASSRRLWLTAAQPAQTPCRRWTSGRPCFPACCLGGCLAEKQLCSIVARIKFLTPSASPAGASRPGPGDGGRRPDHRPRARNH